MTVLLPTAIEVIEQLLDEVEGLGMKVTLATVTNGANTVTSTDARLGTVLTTKFQGSSLWIPSAAAANRERQIVSHALSAGTTTITTNGPVFSAGQTNVSGYIMGLSPTVLINILNDALNLEYYELTVPLTGVTDGDLQTSGVGSWTDTNATSTKDTSTAFLGRQSLKVANSAANGHAATGALGIVTGRSGRVWAIFQASTATARLRVVDASGNSLGSIASTQGIYVYGYVDYTPAATGESIAIWAQGDESTAVSYWSAIGLVDPATRITNLPSWITKSAQLRGLARLTFADSTNESNISPAFSMQEHGIPKGLDGWRYMDEQTSIRPFRIALDFSPSDPIVIKAMRLFGDLDAFTLAGTETTSCDQDRMVARVKHLIAKSYEPFAQYRDDALEAVDQLAQSSETELPLQVKNIMAFSP